MNILLKVVLVFAVVFFAFKFNVLLGFAVMIATGAYIYFSNRAAYMAGRANAEFNKKNYDKAMELYEKAYNSKNRKFTVDISYAQALMRMGKPDKALEIINAILGLRITKELRTSAKMTRCMINYKLGEFQEAYEEASEMFEDGFRTSNMYCLVGLLMLALDKPIDETMRFCEEAYDYDSDNRDNVDNLIVCCLKTGDYKRAAELAEGIVEEHPLFVEGWYHGALALKGLGNRAKALEYANKIEGCNRTFMTTVSEEEVQKLIKELS